MKVKDPNSVVPLHSPTRTSNGEEVGVGVTVGAGVGVGVGWGVLHATNSSKNNVKLIIYGNNFL